MYKLYTRPYCQAVSLWQSAKAEPRLVCVLAALASSTLCFESPGADQAGGREPPCPLSCKNGGPRSARIEALGSMALRGTAGAAGTSAGACAVAERLGTGCGSPRLACSNSDPASMSRDARTMGRDPASMSSDPGSMSSDPGSMSSDPGSMSSDPGSMSSDPGSMSSDPGSMSSDQGGMRAFPVGDSVSSPRWRDNVDGPRSPVRSFRSAFSSSSPRSTVNPTPSAANRAPLSSFGSTDHPGCTAAPRCATATTAETSSNCPWCPPGGGCRCGSGAGISSNCARDAPSIRTPPPHDDPRVATAATLGSCDRHPCPPSSSSTGSCSSRSSTSGSFSLGRTFLNSFGPCSRRPRSQHPGSWGVGSWALAPALVAVLLCSSAAGAIVLGPRCPAIVTSRSFGKGRLPVNQQYPICGMKDSTATKPGQVFRIRVAAKKSGPRWRGWGTTLGEMGSYLGALPAGTRACLGALIFSRRGLNLNIVRYHIPGGYNARYSPEFASNPLLSRGYWPAPNQRFNPLADRGQVAFLLEAKRQGVNLFEAISYSPPWWMTWTKDTQGSLRKSVTNLRPQHRARYAQYVATVVGFLERRFGVRFEAVAPFNEPLEGWWTAGSDKKHLTEGCNFRAPDINDMLPLFRRALGPGRRMAGVDSWVRDTGAAVNRPGKPNQLSMKSVDMLERFNIHGYKLKTSTTSDYLQLKNMRSIAKRLNKPIWQSEWGPLGVNQANDIDVGLLLARKITQHVNVMGAEAWLVWQAAQSINRFWGPLRLSWKFPLKTIYVTKQYFTFLHYTKFVRPGVYPLLVTSKCVQTVLAVYDWRIPRVVVTVVNQRFKKKYLRIALQGFKCTIEGHCLVDVYRTSATESFRLLGRGYPSSILRLQAVPPYSLTTFVIRGARWT